MPHFESEGEHGGDEGEEGCVYCREPIWIHVGAFNYRNQGVKAKINEVIPCAMLRFDHSYWHYS